MNKKVLLTQTILVLSFFLVWQILASFNLINTFIFSSPIRVIKTLFDLLIKYNLLYHIFITFSEILISFILGILISFIISIILYLNKFIAKVVDPFLTMLNSAPKIALGPIIIIWFGANQKSIIVMALLINVIISIITIYSGFISTSEVKLRLFKIFNASKKDELIHLVIPENIGSIISAIKINISLTMIGVIMGEFLVSKSGIGYLICYGTQVFNLDIVITGIFILIFLSYIIYKVTLLINKKSKDY